MGFLKGAALGALVVVPLVAVAVWCTARLGIGNASVTMVEVIRMAAIFAGLASVLTAGGIGRLAAHASTLPGGRRTAIWRAARAQAVASGGLAIIAAIPHGQLPENPVKWLWIVAAGVLSGGLAGTVIGFVCGTPSRPRAPTVKDILRAIPELARTGASGTAIPAQRPKSEPVPVPVPEPEPVAEPVAAPVAVAEPVAVPVAEPESVPVAEPVPVPVPDAKPEPVAAPEPAKPKQRKRRKPPVKDEPKAEAPAPEPGSRAALLVTPPPAVTRLATPSPTQVDTSVATDPSSPTTDGGETPLPKPVPLGDDITGVEDEPVKAVLPLPAEPSIPYGAPLLTPEPSVPVAKVLDRVEHTDVPTDVRNTDVPTDVHTTDVPTDVRTGDVITDVHEPADPTEPRGKP